MDKEETEKSHAKKGEEGISRLTVYATFILLKTVTIN